MTSPTNPRRACPSEQRYFVGLSLVVLLASHGARAEVPVRVVVKTGDVAPGIPSNGSQEDLFQRFTDAWLSPVGDILFRNAGTSSTVIGCWRDRQRLTVPLPASDPEPGLHPLLFQSQILDDGTLVTGRECSGVAVQADGLFAATTAIRIEGTSPDPTALLVRRAGALAIEAVDGQDSTLGVLQVYGPVYSNALGEVLFASDASFVIARAGGLEQVSVTEVTVDGTALNVTSGAEVVGFFDDGSMLLQGSVQAQGTNPPPAKSVLLRRDGAGVVTLVLVQDGSVSGSSATINSFSNVVSHESGAWAASVWVQLDETTTGQGVIAAAAGGAPSFVLGPTASGAITVYTPHAVTGIGTVIATGALGLDSTLVRASSAGLETVAATGDPAAGVDGHTYVNFIPLSSPTGKLAFVAELAGGAAGARGLFLEDDGAFHPLVVTGQALALGPDDERVAQDILVTAPLNHGQRAGSQRVMNASDALAFVVGFDDDSSAVLVAGQEPVVEARVDLGVTLSGDFDPERLEVTFEAVVTNHGPSESWGVTLTLPVPEGLAPALLPAECRHEAGTITCELEYAIDPLLLPGESLAVELPLRFTAVGSYTTTVTVAGYEPDPGPMPNEATATVEVPDDHAELSLSIVESFSEETPPAEVTVTATVVNHGPADVERAELAIEVSVVGMYDQPDQILWVAQHGGRECTGEVCGPVALASGESFEVILDIEALRGEPTVRVTLVASSEKLELELGDNTAVAGDHGLDAPGCSSTNVPRGKPVPLALGGLALLALLLLGRRRPPAR